MTKVTIDDLIAELDDARQLAKETSKPSAMIAATLAKSRLLGMDKGQQDSDYVQPVKVVIQTVNARKPEITPSFVQ